MSGECSFDLLLGRRSGQAVRGYVDSAGEIVGAAVHREAIYTVDEDRRGSSEGKPCGCLGGIDQGGLDRCARRHRLLDSALQAKKGFSRIRTGCNVAQLDCRHAIPSLQGR